MSSVSILWTLLWVFATAGEQTTHFVSFDAEGSTVEWVSDTKGRATLLFSVKDGYHIQVPNVGESAVIPTKFQLSSPHLTLDHTEFDYVPYTIRFPDGTVLQTMDGNITLSISFTKKEKIESQNTLEGILAYQTCDSRKCYFPRELVVKMDL
ncbi:hypothetical protein [Flagellimonas myxillae]|uniref:hypothetical protein n=1 Tax=Flagellimonas myxillae TaxID=2942214 RepID=UPI00201F830C|nr:hypothetical protein [Muricauda myxillae]MCL6267683.1 hypothetical protein [Muricauda myxillae]